MSFGNILMFLTLFPSFDFIIIIIYVFMYQMYV